MEQANDLREEILAACEWLEKTMKVSGYSVDRSLEGLKELDRFVDEQKHPGGLLVRRSLQGQVLFAMGAFIGETIITAFGGSWTEEGEGEMSITVKTGTGVEVQPVNLAMKRLVNGQGDSIYESVLALGKEDEI